MANRKKKKAKPNLSRQQDLGTRMNIYFRNMKEILGLCSCGHLVDMIPPIVKKGVYQIRQHPPKLYPEDCKNLSKKQFKEIQEELDLLMHDVGIPLTEGGPQLPAYKFYTYLTTIEVMRDLFARSNDPAEQEICRTMDEHLNINELETKLREKLCGWCNVISFRCSRPPFNMVRVFPVFRENIDKNKNMMKFAIRQSKQQIKMFDIRNLPRPAFRIGIVGYTGEQLWTKVNRSFLENIPFDEQETVPVYIQSHAMKRLKERLDTFTEGDLHFHTICSFTTPKVIRSRGHYLLEYEILGKKFGYWVARLTDDALIIQTFLFLTAHTAPEGQKLEKLSGLSKIDIKYWNIDRLSTFYLSDLKDNPTIRQLFCDAGCGGLFDLSRFAQELTESKYKLSNKLLSYMQPSSQPDLSALAG